jgi:ribosomal-protein-alanine N-acetyltransferase
MKISLLGRLGGFAAAASPPPPPRVNSAEFAVERLNSVMSAMQIADLTEVLAIESQAYATPWTNGNFVDSLAAGYWARLRRDASGELIGYFVAMAAVGEVHLLNLSVAPARQGRGHGLEMLQIVADLARAQGAAQLWLEVRSSNLRAQALYQRFGLETVGVRKRYYPAPDGSREDALVMSLSLGADGDVLV